MRASIWPKALFLRGSYPAEADTLNRPNVRLAQAPAHTPLPSEVIQVPRAGPNSQA